MRTPAELTQAFRQNGLKVTPQRQAIFRILHGNTTHPTAEAVHAEAAAEMPMLSLRTVYQTLNDLASMGELRALDLGTGAVRFDPNLAPHHHLVCDRCGRVQDVEVELGDDLPPDAFEGFEIREAQLVLRGRCVPACSPRAAHRDRQVSHHHEHEGARGHG
jgi:Fe2+ or Zn2+ uptake regulation protein